MSMQWEISDEEKLLKQSADEFFREKLPVNSLRIMRDKNDQRSFAPEIFQEMAELGWTSIFVSEEFGGLGLGLRGMSVVLEAAGRQLSPVPLLSYALCAPAVLLEAGTAEQKQSLLPDLAAGMLKIAVAHEEGNQSLRTKLSTLASRDGEGFILRGQKSMVLDGEGADKLLVLARTRVDADGEGLSWFLLDRKAQGIGLKTFRMVDGRLGCQLSLDGVRAGFEDMIGYEGRAGESYQKMIDAAAIGLAAEMFGSAQRAFEMTLAYLKERRQFGVVIGSFQALQHRMAQMYCELELCRGTVQRAAAAFDARESQASAFASLAKAKLSEVFQLVSREGIQLHGGIGMTDEHDIGFYLKRSRISAELFGSAGYHRERYARLLDFA